MNTGARRGAIRSSQPAARASRPDATRASCARRRGRADRRAVGIRHPAARRRGVRPTCSAALGQASASADYDRRRRRGALAESWCGAARGEPRRRRRLASAEHVTAGVARRRHAPAGRPRLCRIASPGWRSIRSSATTIAASGGLEAEVSAAGIVRRVRVAHQGRRPLDGRDQVAGDLSRITVDHILDAARADDGVSISVVRDTIAIRRHGGRQSRHHPRSRNRRPRRHAGDVRRR